MRPALHNRNSALPATIPTRRFWAALALAVVLLKLAVLLADPGVRLFLGDSQVYLASAVTDWVPPDRSFLYGWLIAATAVPAGSLAFLVWVQAALTAGTALLAGLVLDRYLGAGRGVVAALVLLLAAEPLMLFYERYVMTETAAAAAAAVYVAIGAAYLARPRAGLLAGFAAAGTAVLGFRLNLIPVTLVLAALLPLLPLLAERPVRWRERAAWRRPLAHLALSAVLTLACHTAYRHLYGGLSGLPAAYHSFGGQFAMATWTPLLKPEHFSDPEFGRQVLDGIRVTEAHVLHREWQLWAPTGISNRLHERYGGMEGAVEEGSRIAVRVALSDPLGIVGVGLGTIGDYLERDMLSFALADDRQLRAIEPDLAEILSGHFGGVPPGHAAPTSPTWRWQEAAGPYWYWLLLLSPLLLSGPALLLAEARRRPQAAFVVLLGLGMLLAGPFLAQRPVVRYLHPMVLPAFLLAGIILDGMLRRARGPAGRDAAAQGRGSTVSVPTGPRADSAG